MNQSGRMENVREALALMDALIPGPLVAAALAEVEEWEALRGRIKFCPYCAHGYEWQDSDPVEGPCAGCARAEAAEAEAAKWNEIAFVAMAEADRLKAALGDPADLARRFHETYERLAPSFGYDTRPDSAVPWDEVPERNRNLMIAVCAEVARAALGPADRNTTDG